MSPQGNAHNGFSDSLNSFHVSQETQSKIFERFFRGDPSRQATGVHAGLGLAIVKHALQRHGGWLDVQSTEGKGSTFTCHFPPQRIWQATMHAAASA